MHAHVWVMLLTITLSAIHLSVSNVTFVSFNILECAGESSHMCTDSRPLVHKCMHGVMICTALWSGN